MLSKRFDAPSLARLFRNMGDPSRVRILAILREGEENVTSLCRQLKMRQPSVSHHLAILRMGGLVVARRDGKRVFYGLAEPAPSLHRGVKDLLAGVNVLRVGPMFVGLSSK